MLDAAALAAVLIAAAPARNEPPAKSREKINVSQAENTQLEATKRSAPRFFFRGAASGTGGGANGAVP